MKWGIRRYRNYDGTLTEEGKKRYDGGSTLGSKLKGFKDKIHVKRVGNADKIKMNPTSMSDDELRNVVSRMRLEKEYKQLYSDLHPGRFSQLKKTASDILSNSAKTIVSKSIENAFKEEPKKTKEQEAQDKMREFTSGLKYETIGEIRNYSAPELAAINKYLTQLNLSETTMSTLRERNKHDNPDTLFDFDNV